MKQKITQVSLFVFIILFSITGFTQDGTNDPTFNPIDDGALGGANGGIGYVLQQPDGKIIISGDFTTYGLYNRNTVARLNADESLDLSLDSGTGVDGYIETMALQPDGKIIVVGGFASYNGSPCNNIARLNTDGSLDETFNTGTGADSNIFKVIVQPDGKVVVSGLFTMFNGEPHNRIVRLNSSGSIDSSFNIGTGANAAIRNMAIQSDGKIIAVGSFITVNGYNRKAIVRLNTNGSVDTGFNSNYSNSSTIRSVAVQNDGKIYIGFAQDIGLPKNVYRLNTDGLIDIDFDIEDSGNLVVLDLVIQPDEKVLVSGTHGLIRVNIDGSLDETFERGITDTNVWSLAQTPDGKIIAGGWFTEYNGQPESYLTKLNADGSPDTSFNGTISTGASDRVNGFLPQPGNKMIITGDFTHYNNVAKKGIARIDQDGVLDNNYAAGTGPNLAITYSANAPDGKIIIAGGFTTYNGTPVNRLARLNADGSLDVAFNAGAFLDFWENPVNVSAIAVQQDGKVLVGVNGTFISYNGAFIANLCRLNTDGTLDESFNTDFMPIESNQTVTKITILQDSSILVAANYASQSNQQTLFKVNSVGTPDPAFTPLSSTVMRTIDELSIQADGKILVFGRKYTSASAYEKKFYRLNADGSTDTSFEFGSVDQDTFTILDMYAQPDGKIILGGMFSEYNGMARQNIMRINGNGTLDETFDSGLGANGPIYAILPQQDKIVIAGDFTEYDGAYRTRIARLHSAGALSTNAPLRNENEVIVFKNNGIVNVNSTIQPVTSIKVFDMAGRLLAQKNNINGLSAIVDKMLQENVILIVKVELSDGSQISKKIY